MPTAASTIAQVQAAEAPPFRDGFEQKVRQCS